MKLQYVRAWVVAKGYWDIGCGQYTCGEPDLGQEVFVAVGHRPTICCAADVADLTFAVELDAGQQATVAGVVSAHKLAAAAGWDAPCPNPSHTLWVDIRRTDIYIPDGSIARPYRDIPDAVAVARAQLMQYVTIMVCDGVYSTPVAIGYNCHSFTLKACGNAYLEADTDYCLLIDYGAVVRVEGIDFYNDKAGGTGDAVRVEYNAAATAGVPSINISGQLAAAPGDALHVVGDPLGARCLIVEVDGEQRMTSGSINLELGAYDFVTFRNVQSWNGPGDVVISGGGGQVLFDKVDGGQLPGVLANVSMSAAAALFISHSVLGNVSASDGSVDVRHSHLADVALEGDATLAAAEARINGLDLDDTAGAMLDGGTVMGNVDAEGGASFLGRGVHVQGNLAFAAGAGTAQLDGGRYMGSLTDPGVKFVRNAGN